MVPAGIISGRGKGWGSTHILTHMGHVLNKSLWDGGCSCIMVVPHMTTFSMLPEKEKSETAVQHTVMYVTLYIRLWVL